MKLLPYPKYKQSGVEWLGEVPAHWEVRTLTSIANEITTGPFGSQLHASEYVEDGIPVVNPAHIVAGYIRPDILSSVDDATALRLERHRLKQHDVIVGRRGEIGRCAVVGRQEDGWLCGTGALVVRLHNSDPRYILAVFSGAGFREVLSLNAVGTTMLNLNPMIVGRMLSPVPPLPEQRAIADFLHRETSRLDTLVAKKRTLIERLREKRTALISRAVTRGLPPDAACAAGLDAHPKLKPSGIGWFGDVPAHWDTLRLGYVVEKVGSGKTPRGGAEIYQPKGILLIRSQNVHGTGLRLADAVFIDETVDEEMAGSRVQPRDILLNITGASIGRCCIAPTDLPSANVNQHVCIVRVRQATASSRFIQSAISSQPLQEQIFSFENGSSREGLNFQQVRGLLLAIPSVLEQRAIAGFLDRETAKIDSVVAKTEAAIERLHEYRTALITAAVTGKVDIRGTVVPEEDAT